MKTPASDTNILNEVNHLLSEQCSSWELAQRNYTALHSVQSKKMKIERADYIIQFNPSRIISSTAKVDTISIQERKCFLCRQNLPAAQKGIIYQQDYIILVNPFPIFPRHLTIPHLNHTDQRIESRLDVLLDLTKDLNEFVLFYNGPKCGASAPDHFHFQAGNKGFLPTEAQHSQSEKNVVEDFSRDGITSLLIEEGFKTAFILQSADKEVLLKEIRKTLSFLSQIQPEEDEPMINLLAWSEGDDYILYIYPRKQHRPSCYFAEGRDQLILSPASVDLGSVFITPREEDFQKIEEKQILQILQEICIDKNTLAKFKSYTL